MTLFNITRAIDTADNTISYEINEAIEYIIQDAFGVASFDELSDEQVSELQDHINELDHNTSFLVPEIQFAIDVRDKDNA